MRILVGCEFSQVVTKAFRAKGHEAYSCDIIPAEGGHSEWHIQDDVLNHLDDGWDMMIAFPPCTYLSSVQTHLCRLNIERTIKRIAAADFFMKFINAKINKIAVENPTGVMSHIYRKADQIVHPYFFGDQVMKRTCLWLKNLPLLEYADQDNLFSKKTYGEVLPPTKEWIQKSTGKRKLQRQVNIPFLSGKERSKLSPFLAEAMADQWNFS